MSAADGARPAISIALATCNGERFLAEQLDSLLAQSLMPAELVVADDRSTDATVAILRGFAARAPFPVSIHENEERLGYRRNFRRAAGLCRGEIISFCDQDDVWLPAKLATIARCFEDPSVLLAYHNVRLLKDGVLTGRLYDASVERALLCQEPLPPWHFSFGLTQSFRAELRAFDDLWDLSKDHLQDEILAHDQWYVFLALALGTVRFVDEDLIRYRQHEASTYGSTGVKGRWRRLLDRFAHDPLYDRFGSASARSRAAILGAVAVRTGRSDLAEAIRRYEGIADRLDRRRLAYVAAGPARRLTALARSVAKGDYRGNPWGFDWKSIPRDVVTGVLRGGPDGAGSGHRETPPLESGHPTG